MPASRYRLDGLDVVPVPVSGEHAANSERSAQGNEQLVLVRGIDEDRLATPPAPHDVRVVLERPDDHLVDPHGRRLVVGGTHGSRIPVTQSTTDADLDT